MNTDQKPLVKLFAWQPKGHGEFSFFVAATSEEEARKAVDGYIALHKGKDDGHYIDNTTASRWGTDYYELKVVEIGEVITNEND
jgi:hypothetical protein